MIPTEKRIEKFKSIIAKKQFDLGIVLENVHNPHNIGAVLRSCDAVGVTDVFLIYSSNRLDGKTYTKGKTTAKGADKWLNVHVFDNAKECMEVVNKKYNQVFATNFSADAKSLYDLKLDTSVALVFGNELDGISKEMMGYVDGNFIIPMEGMVQSLNISVACAVSLFEVRRQRSLQNKYDLEFNPENTDHKNLLEQYINTHGQEYRRKHSLHLE